jgi:hypothetical protein
MGGKNALLKVDPPVLFFEMSSLFMGDNSPLKGDP